MRTVAALALALSSAVATAQTTTFTPFGRPCGGVLAASQVRTPAGPTVVFDVSAAAPGSVAVLAIGHAQRPSPLPGSNCTLLVDPRALHFAQVDRVGQVSFRFPLPPVVPLLADVQVVTVGFDRNGRTAESTNGINITVR